MRAAGRGAPPPAAPQRDDLPCSVGVGIGYISGGAVPLTEFAAALGPLVERPVIDRAGDGSAEGRPAYNAGVDGTSPIRRMLLLVLVLGMIGTLVDLLLLAHYEDTAQIVPIGVLGVALLLAILHAIRPTSPNLRALQGMMLAILIAGVVGVGFHFNGAAEFQREIDPSQTFWQITGKVARAQSPPLLAPGAMLQLGLIGLVYTFRHPVVRKDRA
jgi:hypothetical protein